MLVGQYLGREGEAVRVTIEGTPSTGTPNADGTRLTFPVPAELPMSTKDTVELKIAPPGRDEISLSLRIEKPMIRSAWRTGDRTIAVAAVGWHGPDLTSARAPQVLVNGRPAVLGPAWRGDPGAPLVAELPPNVDSQGELRVAVVDDLGRRSADLVLG